MGIKSSAKALVHPLIGIRFIVTIKPDSYNLSSKTKKWILSGRRYLFSWQHQSQLILFEREV
jgi:hypothetical protein